ncbi:hypothetical protein [[Mycobacterium] nativiensis]|uniref:Uncharacterized protein n=1 Tax=[Mycobacterium] nativiensis TaxID=2855503 RepID=A0ABU5XZX6_9MYCO|nr:hypothetical protein [Mycolicibacter sp. MYC340]MEB3033322.1 hypothetical protein [Mycolicibacter sp. MYC340]
MTPLLALTITICLSIVSICLLAGFIVYRTGATAGIADVARAIGSLLAAFITAVTRLL